ncbi:MAG TPA: hypothetical protein VMU20_07295 [Candidatus Dormibacteraeota bacterium]|nr:hypothetical protein [Candidatus Dormibacteraeota bacterium]
MIVLLGVLAVVALGFAGLRKHQPSTGCSADMTEREQDRKRHAPEYDSAARAIAAVSHATYLHSAQALEEEAGRLQQTEIPKESP